MLIKPAEEVMAIARQHKKVGLYRFPEDLGPHAIVLNFKEYTYQGGIPSNRIIPGVDINASIVLPIPSNLQDSYTVNLGPNQLGIKGAAATAFMAKINESGSTADFEQMGKDAADSIWKMAQDAMSGQANVGTMARYFARAGLGSIDREIGEGIDVSTGNIINPHTALTFNGVNLKSFTFQWNFAPKTETEHRTLVQILNRIKRNALPRYADIGGNASAANSTNMFARGLLKYPNMVDVFFLGLDQRYFLYYKTCLISEVGIDYSQGHTPLLKGDQGARPVFTQLAMQLQEAEIRTAQDYDEEMI